MAPVYHIRTPLCHHAVVKPADFKAAAHALGFHKSTLFHKIKALGHTLPEHDGHSRRKST